MKKILVILCLLIFSVAIPVAAIQVEPITVYQEFFSVERDNITTASVNIAFGFASSTVARKIFVQTPSSNADDVCIDWLGGTAVCPAANTAGNQRLKPGTNLFIDNIAQNDISVIAASGTQVFQVTAWR